MAALSLPNVGYATNADHGMGCNIHPAAKQFIGKRLAASALGLHYKQQIAWQSPTYKSAAQQYSDVNTHRGPGRAPRSDASSSVSLVVALSDVGQAGLHAIYPFNYNPPSYGSSAPTVVDCTAPLPVNATYNASMSQQCAFAGLHVRGAGWLNASVSVQADGQALVLTAQLPAKVNPSCCLLRPSTTPSPEGNPY